MKIFLWGLIGVIIVLALFNKKLNVFKIIKEQFDIYKDDRTKKISIHDIFTFFIGPFLMALIGSFLIKEDVFIKASELCITIFSIIATILFSFLALLMDKKYNDKDDKKETKERKKFNQVSGETYISITMTIIYSLAAVMVAIILLAVCNDIVIKILNGLMLYFIIKIIFNFLMILKRMFILLN